MNNIVQNPFSTNGNNETKPIKAVDNVDIEAQRAIAEVQASIMLAKKFPRDPMMVCNQILVACQRPLLAESATYCYSRGGTNIKGASIRLAEAIAQQWGNVKYGWKTISTNEKESHIETFAWDLETNVYVSRNFSVEHFRYAKGKKTPLTDPRDIYEVCANNAARRMRACILEVIPSDVVEMALNQCEKTLKSTVKADKETIKNIITAFSGYGITRKMIETFIQRNLEAITPENILRLKQIYQSIKDGMGKVEDFFKVENTETVNLEKETPTPNMQETKATTTQKVNQEKQNTPQSQSIEVFADKTLQEDQEALFEII